jgi:hypothetical protein
VAKRERHAAAEKLLDELAEDDPGLLQDLCVRAIGRSGIAKAVADELELRGVPAGARVIEIDQARRSLHETDDLLRRIREATIRQVRERPLD